MIRDPLLRRIGIGPRREPSPARALKADERAEADSATAAPPAGRTTLQEARRAGLRGWLQVLGPGLVTGASDDDPSGIGTYAQVGAQFGYGMLWTALFTFPLMLAFQELCARIALQTGVGLATVLRRHFPSWVIGVSVSGLIVANTINIGADLGAVAAGLQLLSFDRLQARWLVLPVAALVIGMQFRLTYATIFRLFKWLTLALFAYVVAVFFTRPALPTVLFATFVPHLELSRDFVTAIVAVLGTTISPYLFFWQASSEVEEMKRSGMTSEEERKGTTHTEMQAARLDITVGMFFSQLIMYCIVLTAAAVLFAHGKHDVRSAQEAAETLRPIAGRLAELVFAVGFVGTGLLAIPILSGSAAYAVKEFLGMGGSLALRPRYRPTFYAVLLAATAVGAAINFIGIDPIRALFWSAVINGVIAVPLMALIVLVGSRREVMKRRVSGRLSRSVTWLATGLMAAAAIAMIAMLLRLPGHLGG